MFCLANKLQLVAVVFFRPALIVIFCSLGTPFMNIYLVATLFDTLYNSATEHSFPAYAFVHFQTREAAERDYEATKDKLILDSKLPYPLSFYIRIKSYKFDSCIN